MKRYFVAAQQFGRFRSEADKGLGGLQIDDQLKFRRLLHGQVDRLQGNEREPPHYRF